MAKLLAHHWSSGCLATAYIQSRSCFSVTMASRCEIVDEEYIEELKDKSQNEERRIARSGERTFSENGRMKET